MSFQSIVARGAMLAFAGAVLAASAAAQDIKFFRIGTGGTAGTYYPIGGLIANAISNPPGSRPCADGGSCGVPGLVATAVASNGSVANINGIVSGQLESGFTQSDVAYWAYTGTGVYEGKPKVADLRLIANLYPETIHIVARKGAGIASVADLKGKRVSLDEPGSGTLVDARIILAAFGMTEKDIKPEYLKPNQAGDKMRDGGARRVLLRRRLPDRRDFGARVRGRRHRARSGHGPRRSTRCARSTRFFAPDTIPANTYKGVGEVKTIAVGAQWVTSAKQPDALIYEITKAHVERQLAQAARCRPREGQGDPGGQRDGRRGHSVPSGRREVLQGEGPAQVARRCTAAGRREAHGPDFWRGVPGDRAIDAIHTLELEEKFDPDMRFRPLVPPASAIVAVPADRPLLLPLLHRRLRPAARDHPPRRPPRVRARARVPRLSDAEGACWSGGAPRAGIRRAACRSSTGCWRSPSRSRSSTSPTIFDDLAFRVGNPMPIDWIMGSILVVLLLEATRRAMGWPLPIIAIIFMVYAL